MKKYPVKKPNLKNCLSVFDYFMGLELKGLMGLLAQPKFLRKCVTRFGTIYTILKREKRPWRNVTFSKVPGCSLQLY